jgi:hypothetical protein
MRLIVIDMETFYADDYTLSKLSTEEYIRDPRFEVIGFSYKVDDTPAVWVTGDYAHCKRVLVDLDLPSAAVCCHNTLFDGAILAWHYGVHAKKWIDTLCMGRALHGVDAGGSLAAMAQRYGVGIKGTEVVQAKNKRRADFTPAELTQYGVYCVNDTELTYALFNRMLEAGFPIGEMRLIDLTIKMFTKPMLVLDTPLLEAHYAEVVQSKAKHLAKALMAVGKQDIAVRSLVGDEDAKEEIKSILMSNPQFATMLQSLGVEPPRKVSLKTGKGTWAFAKTDDGLKALEEHEDPRVQTLVAARLGVKSTLEETRTLKFIAMSKRGPLPVPLKFFGARTGRWSGEGGGVNFQNLPRSSEIKKAIKAPEGYELVGVDLSNIELRVGLWLAGETERLAQLGVGRDLYKDFASAVFNVPYDQVTENQRFIGKTSQLSLIYGVGAAKLRQAIKTGPGSDGTDIGEDEAKRIVEMYRRDYSGVVKAWGQGAAALAAMRDNQHMPLYRIMEVMGSEGIKLPSGILMRYPELQKSMVEGKEKWTYKTRKGLEYLYGAKVFQGITQAVARCVMGDNMPAIDKAHPTVLTVHDAVYALARLGHGAEACAKIIALMCRPPAWMPDIPLAAEGAFGPTLFDC